MSGQLKVRHCVSDACDRLLSHNNMSGYCKECQEEVDCSIRGCTSKLFAVSMCSKHYNRVKKYGTPFLEKDSFDARDLTGPFVCSACAEEKEASFFRKRHRFGYEFYERVCKECQLAQNKKWQKNNKDRSRQLDRNGKTRRTYGAKGLEYRKLIDAGEATCFSCGETKNLHIDHCHATGETRGILCHWCNTALGLLKEDIEKMDSLAKYTLSYKNILRSK